MIAWFKVVELDFYGCKTVRPPHAVKECAGKYYPAGRGDFSSIRQASEQTAQRSPLRGQGGG